MKLLVGLLLTSTLIFAQSDKLIIDAKNFETNDAKGITIFTGNVKFQMAKDKLNAQKLEIHMKAKSKTKKPLKYVATGNASFVIHTNGKIYEGKGNQIVYNPVKKEYIVTGNGHIKERVEKRELFGEKIYINQLTGNAKVSGSDKKPVRFIINIESDEKKK